MNSGTYVFVAKEAIRNTSADALRQDVLKALKRVGALK